MNDYKAFSQARDAIRFADLPLRRIDHSSKPIANEQELVYDAIQKLRDAILLLEQAYDIQTVTTDVVNNNDSDADVVGTIISKSVN